MIKMSKIHFLSLILACLVILYQSTTLQSFAGYFTCEKDKKVDVPDGSYCCGDPVPGEPNYYLFKVQSSSCSENQSSFGMKAKVSDTLSVRACPCNKMKIQ